MTDRFPVGLLTRLRRLALALTCSALAAGAACGPRMPVSGPGPAEEANEPRREARRPDSPDAAMEWVLMAQRDEFGRIAPNGLMTAREQVRQMRARQAARGRGRGNAGPATPGFAPGAGRASGSGAAAPGFVPGARASAAEAASGSAAAAAAGISAVTWSWIGPGNIGGRTRAIAVHPATPSLIFAGSVAGGIWRSTNSGSSWAVVDDFMTNLAVTSIVFQPGNPSVMLAATGEGFFNQDAIRGAGIFLSVDTGTTWTQLASTAPTPANQNFIYVNRLAFSADGATLLAVTNNGLYRSTDLGGSWTKPLNVNYMSDAKFLHGSSTNAVASNRAREAYYSTNGGASWTIAGGLNGSCSSGSTNCRVELAVSQSSPAVVFASLEVSGGNSQVWKSTNSGVSYTQTDTGAATNKLGGQGWYDNVIWVDPTNVNHVIVGGVSLYRSTDGGVTFSSALVGIHADHHAIVADPEFNGTTNRRVYFGGDGGLYKSETVSAGSAITFTTLNSNYGVTQFYGGSSVSNGKIFGGTQDNGSLLYTPANGPQAWTAMAGGDGGFAAGDPTNANYMYGEYQWMQVHRSSNGGASSSSISGCNKAAPYKLTDGCASSSASANFIAPILLDPNNPQRLLAGGANLWRTNDARTANTGSTGPSWAIIKATVGSNVSAIAVALGDSNLVWTGHNNGNVYSATNGTAASPAWTRLDFGTSLPNRAVTSIAIDPADPDIVYLSFGGFNSGNVWKTTNAGGSWADAAGAVDSRLPDAPVRSIAIHPTQPGWIYAGTDVGVFASQDAGATWSVPHDGPANVAVFQLFFSGTKLVAVTHGRGMFVAETVSENPPEGINIIQNGDFSGGLANWQLYEPPDIVNNAAANGVFQWHRASPMTTASQQATVFQTTGEPVAAGSPVVAQFDLGNADTVRKRVSVLVLDADFSDLAVCTFWLPASAPMRTFQMRTHPTRDWASASIYFYAASDGTGDYLLDNVTLAYQPALASDRTECIDPIAPGAPGGGTGPNLLTNGDFGTGALAPWTTYGAITTQIVSGVFDFYRPSAPAGTPAGVILQQTGQAVTTGEILTATFQLGNNSTVRKRVTVLMHDADFSDLAACSFWLAPGQTLDTYTMRTYATDAWSDATLAVYAATVGSEAWIRLDAAALQRTPGTAPLGTECIEPAIGAETVPGGVITSAASSPRAPTTGGRPEATRTGRGGADRSRRGFAAAAADLPVARVGETAAPVAAGAVFGGMSVALTEPIDLTTVTGARLTFASRFTGALSVGSVQVSVDGSEWQTVAVASPAGDWTAVGVDLDAFAGQVIHLRFTHDRLALAAGAAPGWWLIGDVTLAVRR